MPAETKRVPISTEDGYRLWAESYDSYPNGLITVEEPIVRRLVGDVSGRRVLDAACGTGRHTAWLFDRGAHVVGVDASPAMLDVARHKRPDLELINGAIEALPFADGCFDVALNALLLEHLPSVELALSELARVVRPSGRVVVSVFHPFFLLKGVPPHFDHADGNEYALPGHVHLVSDYVRALRKLGLELEELLEPVVDDALVARHPTYAKHRGWPIAVIFAARKPSS